MANPQAPHVPGNVRPADPPASEQPESLPQQGLVGSKDKFSANELNQFPVQPTVDDALGIERIVGPRLDNWRPADVEPDPAEQERLARVHARGVAARDARHEAFTSSHPAAAASLKAANDQARENDAAQADGEKETQS